MRTDVWQKNRDESKRLQLKSKRLQLKGYLDVLIFFSYTRFLMGLVLCVGTLDEKRKKPGGAVDRFRGKHQHILCSRVA